jgi:hypothetical protein
MCVPFLFLERLSLSDGQVIEKSTEELFEKFSQLMNECNDTQIIVESNNDDDPLQQKLKITPRSQYIQISPSNPEKGEPTEAGGDGDDKASGGEAAVFLETTV